MKILRMKSVKTNPLATYRDPTVCRDIAFNDYLPSTLSEIARLERQRGVVIYKEGLSSSDLDYNNYRAFRASAQLGATLVDTALPPYKVDEAIVRPKPRSPHTRAQFEQWRREGKIVITEVSLGEIRTVDHVSLRNPRILRAVEGSDGSPQLRAMLTEAWDPCRKQMELCLPSPEGSATPINAMACSADASHTYSIRVLYELAEGEASTVLTDYRSVVRQVQSDILSAYMAVEVPTELATSKVSELNEATYDLLTDLAELPDTVSMLYSALKKILIYTKEVQRKERILKRKNLPPDQLLTELSSLWMSYRYGIMPVIYSIEDGLEYLEKSGILYRTVRGRQDEDLELPSYEGFTLSGSLIVQNRVFGKGRLSATTVNGVGMNLAVTLWEKVPLSFVVDWVLNIGDLLGALFPSVDYDQRVFSWSKRLKGTVNILIDGNVIPVHADLYDRSLINPIDHIGLSFNPTMTIKRKLDTLSLSWLMFLKDWRKFK